MRLIDAHIHLDMYSDHDRKGIMNRMQDDNIDSLIAVSNDIQSAQRTLELAREDERIKPAFGFHPEQAIIDEGKQAALFQFMERNVEKMVAVGEVGLPYYSRKENPSIELAPYLDLLERFIQFAVRFDKPIVLHTIYEDANIVYDLLEKYRVERAHFHWFKGDDTILRKIMKGNYVISVTPDVCYKPSIQRIVQNTPLENLLLETDGPWKFEGPFLGAMTEPNMMHQSVKVIAQMKQKPLSYVYETIYNNTCMFYRINDF